jgi:enhancing lycopene biosynthesis protein 2
MPTRVAVVLCGSGALDGTDIHEAVCCFLALSQAGAQTVVFAPDAAQYRVANHLTGQDAQEQRNMLTEAARLWIKVRPLHEADPEELDTVLLPGGFGASRSLANLGFVLDRMQLIPDMARLLNGLADRGKPLGAICVASGLLAGLMRDRGVTGARIAIAGKEHFVQAVRDMGQTPVDAGPTGVVVDEKNRLVTGHGYMLARKLDTLWTGVEAVVAELMKMTAKG